MKFSSDAVAQYLKIVRDDNPIHDHVVPGQMIVQKVLQDYGMQNMACNVRYKQPVYINEPLNVYQESDSFVVKNEQDVVKVKIIVV
ncbi:MULTISPECIES: hypothetical protein [unclassified Staphylococcus]|uniref:hypothetical protein n=1 Tax=unclassified Staphylococcus TaxID=91994 RepID=UPI0021D15C01|nr:MULTISPECIES: hypothetical protein [unclassified Staphylococcus]UXR78606.1 hypothetical protein MUA92_01555 [Staphylococcus sp. IVB6227]UXR82764.1 hypothetical protein MUA51_01525 [Staphylococcus sp. IVB6214]